MPHLPTIRQLQYLVALQAQGHFGRAARECSVSQSAFSVAIRQLEEQLGVQLVERTRRRVAMTPVGEEVAGQAQRCLRQLEGLVEFAAGRQGILRGPLRLGTIPTIAPFLLPRLLPALHERYPELELHIQEGKTDAICAQLRAGSLDLLLLALPWELPGTETLALFRDPFLLAFHEGTRWIDPERYRPGRLPAESVLLLEEGHCLRDHALEACRLRRRAPVNRFSAASFHTLLEMVDQDLGVTFVPELARQSPLLRRTRIRTRPAGERAFREIALAWRSGSFRAEEFRAFGEVVRAVH